MTADQVFAIANPIALAGWILLMTFPRKAWSQLIVRLIPLLLAVTYVFLLAVHWGESAGGFGSLKDVTLLFTNPWVLLAGWIHYLAFDLFTGAWEVRDAVAKGIPHWMILPCLILTFLFGPAGLLLYFVIRMAKVRASLAA